MAFDYKKAGYQEPFLEASSNAGTISAHVIPTGIAYRQGWLQKDNPIGDNNMQEVQGQVPPMQDEFGGFEEARDGFKYNTEMGEDPRRPREQANTNRAMLVAGILGISAVAAGILLRNPGITARITSAGKNMPQFISSLKGSAIVEKAVKASEKITGGVKQAGSKITGMFGY